MNIIVLGDDQHEKIYSCDEHFIQPCLKNKHILIPSGSKEDNAIEILKAYLSDAKAVLYDSEHKALEERIRLLDFDNFNTIDFSTLLFTSGSTGAPTGAFKTKQQLQADVTALVSIFGDFNATKVVATVPFVHIYGLLAGLLLPYTLQCDLLFKEHFLPHDLLAEAKPHCIIVTTPLYIKALLRLEETRNLKETIFISSTGPLPPEIAQEFTEKFNTTLFQLFGSTETGSIAYKKQGDTFWTPFESVDITLNEEGLLHVSSPFSSTYLWNNALIDIGGAVQTFDYATIKEGKFQLLGRSHTIIKIAGKRYATAQIEDILETIEGVEKALIHVKHHHQALKDEMAVIYIQASRVVRIKEIKASIKKAMGKINFPIELKLVEEISTSLVGKKIIPKMSYENKTNL